tara:strand:+ start:529 stop:852 length:324 start_codon:yes stop_codon:yes gene_type:complete
MTYDHEAIRKAYPNDVNIIDDGTGIFDMDGNPFSVDQSKVDEARVELNKLIYRDKRVAVGVSTSTKYASYGDQMDMIYKDLLAGTFTTSGTWATHIKAVKDANPKPS